MVSSFCRTLAVVMTFGHCLISVVTQVAVRDNATPVKGRSIQLICQGILTGTSIAEIFRTDHETLVASDVYLNRCVRDACLPESIPRYDFAADKNNVYINITGLQRTDDEKWWTCVYSSTVMKRFITVITVPASLVLINPPTSNRDLAFNEVILLCQTSCSYPAPEIKWFYTEVNSPKQTWSTGASSSSSGVSCTDSEQIYSSKLILPRYTVFVRNIDTSVRFQCGISSYLGINDELLTPHTIEIRFAVKVTVVSVRHGTTILTDASQLQVISGESITLTCISNESRPEAIIVWYIDNVQKQAQGSTFTFIPTDNDRNKRVNCKAYNFGNIDDGVLSEKPVLNVLVAITSVRLTVPSTNNVTVTENLQTQFVCETSGSKPEALVRWYQDNRTPDNYSDDIEIVFNITVSSTTTSNGTVVVTSRLQLVPSRQDFGRRIYCTAKNLAEYTAVQSDLKPALVVNYGPEITDVNVPSIFEVTEGEEVADVICSADCFPSCSYIWTYRNNVISSSGKLSLDAVRRQQSGNYTCMSKNAATGKSSSATITVVVYYSPDVSIRLSHIEVVQNKAFILYCDANGVPAIYNYRGFTQTYNDHVIQNKYRLVNSRPLNSSFHIMSAQLQDSGTYSCYVNNGVNSTGSLDQRASVDITVKVQPVILQKNKIFYGSLGASLNITTHFYSYPAFTNITVFRSDGFLITDSEEYRFDLLTTAFETTFYKTKITINGTLFQVSIKNLEKEDFATYLIAIANEIGYSSVEIDIIEKSKPLPPTTFKISVSLDMLLLYWESSSNGGDKQSFLIQTTREGKEHWDNQAHVQESDTQHMISEGHYIANLTDLPLGVYRCRVIAANSFGNAEAVYFPEYIDINKPALGKISSNTGLIVGLVLGVVVIGLVVCVVLLLIKLKRNADFSGDAFSAKSTTSLKKERQLYANVTFDGDSTTQGEQSQDENSVGQYSSLDNQSRDDARQYDVLNITQ